MTVAITEAKKNYVLLLIGFGKYYKERNTKICLFRSLTTKSGGGRGGKPPEPLSIVIIGKNGKKCKGRNCLFLFSF